MGVAAFFVTAFNIAFWRQFSAALAPLDVQAWLFIAAIGVTALVLLSLFFSLFTPRYLFKPAITVFLLLTSAAAYFVNEYGIVIDGEMIRNIANTNTEEAYDLLTGGLILYVGGLGALPALVLWALPIWYRPLLQDLWFKTKAAALLLRAHCPHVAAAHRNRHVVFPRAPHAAARFCSPELSERRCKLQPLARGGAGHCSHALR